MEECKRKILGLRPAKVDLTYPTSRTTSGSKKRLVARTSSPEEEVASSSKKQDTGSSKISPNAKHSGGGSESEGEMWGDTSTTTKIVSDRRLSTPRPIAVVPYAKLPTTASEMNPIQYAVSQWRVNRHVSIVRLDTKIKKAGANGKSGQWLFYKHIKWLRTPNTKINDEVINEFFGLLNQREIALAARDATHRKNLFCTIGLMNSLYGNHRIYNFNAVMRWNKDCNLFAYNKVFFLVNHSAHGGTSGIHWSLVVADMVTKCVSSYDSCDFDCSKFVDCVLDYLFDHAVNYKYVAADNAEAEKKLWRKVYKARSPKQINDKDCGVFLMVNGWHIDIGLDLVDEAGNFVYDLANIDEFREIMAYNLHMRSLTDNSLPVDVDVTVG